MQCYRTNQVGGRASQVGGIAYNQSKLKQFRIVRYGGNPPKVAVATSSIMQVINIKLKLLAIENKIEHLQQQ